MNGQEIKPKIVLHACCAVCAAALTDLLKEKFEVLLFFYNPNIHPEEEYQKRKDSVKQLAASREINFFEGEYDKDYWLEKVKGLEGEPEGGKRCLVCFEKRLLETANFAKNQDVRYFTTTLSVSPFKNETIINELGVRIAKEKELEFLNFEKLGINKKEVWQKTGEISKKENFYHQKYCGCIFSIPKK